MSQERLDTAEQFIREETCLYRHYHIAEVQLSVAQFTEVQITKGKLSRLCSRYEMRKGWEQLSTTTS